MNIKMVDKYCGLGNIVKGVKKRKKKSDSSNRHYAFPYDDQLRTNESVHTLLSKLDIVDKKLEKFDQSHPLPTQIQGFRGMMGVNQDNSYPKLQVQLPDNWLELMKNCESRGNRPCLEVTVKSDCNCREELQYGVPCSRRAAYTDSKSGRRTCSCEMARRDALETCYGAKSQRSTVSADQRNGYSTCSCNNHQYVTAESSVPCEESPNTMPFSKVPKRSTPPPRSTGMITKNISQGARGSEECLETAPLASLCGAPSELSESAPSVSSNRNPLSVRPCVAWMEPRCQEIEEEVDYSNNNQSYATRVPKQVEFETDSGDCPDQKSPSTIGSYPSCGQEYSPEQNATSGCSPYRSSPCASRCRELNQSQTDQLVLYPGFGAVSPVSCCQDAARQNDSKTRASSRNENKVVEPSEESNKSGASPNCLCAQAICMIQNCSKHQRRQPSQQRGQCRAGEPASQETSCTLYGNCESQFTTLVVNIPRTPIVTSSPAEHKSGLEERNFGVQNYGLVEFGRLAPIKSCECDIIRDTTGISQSPPRITQSTPPPPDSDNVQSRSSPGKSTQSTNSHKEAGQLEKKCSLSPKRNSQHDNIDSNNQIASPKPKSSHEEQDPGSPQDGKLDSSKDGSPQKPKTLPERQDGRGSHSENTDPSRPSKDGSPQKHKMSPGRQDTRGSHSGNKGPHRPSKDEDSSTNGKADTSLVIQDEVKFEGQGESEIPINEPEKHREIFSASDPSSAPLLLLRRGFVQMHQPFLAPSGSNLNNITRECDLRSCSVKSAQRDLFIGEGTILTSHPSNISTHKEFHAIDDGVSKSAFSPQSSLNKPSVEEESQIPRGSSEDFKVLTVTQAENYVLPMLPQDESLVTEKPKAAHNKYKDDGFNPQNDPISGKSQLHDYGLSEDIQQHSGACSCCNKCTTSKCKLMMTYVKQQKSQDNNMLLEHSDHDGALGNEDEFYQDSLSRKILKCHDNKPIEDFQQHNVVSGECSCYNHYGTSENGSDRSVSVPSEYSQFHHHRPLQATQQRDGSSACSCCDRFGTLEKTHGGSLVWKPEGISTETSDDEVSHINEHGLYKLDNVPSENSQFHHHVPSEGIQNQNVSSSPCSCSTHCGSLEDKFGSRFMRPQKPYSSDSTDGSLNPSESVVLGGQSGSPSMKSPLGPVRFSSNESFYFYEHESRHSNMRIPSSLVNYESKYEQRDSRDGLEDIDDNPSSDKTYWKLSRPTMGIHENQFPIEVDDVVLLIALSDDNNNYSSKDKFSNANSCSCSAPSSCQYWNTVSPKLLPCSNRYVPSTCQAEPANDKPLSPSADYKFHDQYKVEQSEMEKQWYRDKTKPKNTNSEPHEKMDGKEKCCEDSQKRVSDSEKQNYSASVTYKFQDHHKTEQSEGEKQWHRDKTKPKNSNSEPPEKLEEGKAKSSEVRQRHVSDHPEHYREGDLQVPKITSETFIDVPTCKNQSVSVHKRSNREASRRAKIRGKDKSFSHAEISSRSNSLNSKKTIPRVCDSERQRIHKLARKCIQKHSASRSTVANFSLISPSYCNKDTKNNYKAASLSSTSSQSYNRAPSNLKNQEYLKELIFPFAQQGPRLSEQEESVTQKSIQKFVIERIIRINPCVQDYEEATQFSDLTEDDGEENCAPRSLEAFIGSRPAISGTSTCPTGYAPSTASKPSYIGGALGSRAVSDFVRGTFMRLYGTEEDERSEENFIYHAFPSFDDPTNQSLDVFDDAIAGGRQQSSVERTRKYELMEEYLRDSMLKSLYSKLQGEAPPHSWDSARNGFQNQAKTTIFHQDVNRTILAPAKLVASSSTDDNHQDTHCTPSDTPIDETKNPYDAFKELIWNSKFNSSDNTVPATKVDSQLIMALRVKGTRTDRNEVHQESFAGLQKYSEIMDLLEIYPGQRRREDPQEVKTRKWIDKINNFEEEKEQEYYAKNNSTKGRKSKRKDHHNSHDIYRVQQLFRKGNVTSRVNLYKNKRYHIPVQSEQSSSRVSISDSNIEPEVRDKEGQSFLVYMNEGGYLFKERCKHGISNRLPKKPPYWFRGTNHNWLSNVKSELPNDFPDHKLVKDRKHTHRNNYRRHHRHKHRKSSDDSLHDETGLTRKKETIVMKPKKQNISERQYRDVRVPSRSISVSSSSDSSAYEKRVARKPRYSRENDRKITTLTRDNLRYCHRDSLDVANLKKSGKPRSGKNKRISVNSYKQKNYQIKSALKKSKEKSGSSTTVNERETSSTDSSSYTSMPRRKSKDHLPQVRLVKHPNTQTARHVKLSHSPMPIKRVKVKRKAPNAIHNCRHRLITADSKSSASYEKVNVKDFIDLLATLSRNTISTLTNKKKALKLYRNHLYSPRRR